MGAELTDTVRQLARSNPLQPASAEAVAAVRDLPLIDVHAHSFNARYLPIQGILLGKRDITPWAALLHDDWAREVAAAIASATELAPLPGLPERLDPRESSYRAAFGRDGRPDADDPPARVEPIEKLGDALRSAFQAHAGSIPPVAARLDAVEREVDKRVEAGELETLESALGMLHDLEGSAMFTHFLTTLLTRDDDQIARFHADFEQEVDLVVSHMMDLAPVYAQKEDGALLEPFARSQVPRMEHFQDDAQARMVYFVAYNPFRDNLGRGGTAMRIVEDAIEQHGAWGVKVYPPSGYRPANNVIPCRPLALGSSAAGEQWSARYEGVTAERLDQRLDALFDYCHRNDIPIFAHCSPGEFEARKGYSIQMADPRWWRPVLEKYPKLRLCLGHAGGNQFWFGLDGPQESWGRMVYELCVEYENVYCEFGVHAEVLTDDRRDFFIALLSRLIEVPQGSYPFEEKILYGSDWFMPREVESQIGFLEAYRRCFTDLRLIDHYAAFFARNALAYLNAKERLLSDPDRLPESVRAAAGALIEESTVMAPRDSAMATLCGASGR